MSGCRRWLWGVLSGRDRSWPARGARFVLGAVEPVYQGVVGFRNAVFDRGVRRVEKLGVPVVSVGNLSVGGTGKTPMVVEVVKMLEGLGARPGVVLRGYKAAGPGDGDEAEVLRGCLGPGVVVETGSDRAAAGRRVLEKDPGVNVIVLDDGFQHRRLGRDLDVVLVDATMPLGAMRVLPRGLLREPVRNLRRADAVVLTHCDAVTQKQIYAQDRQVRRLTGRGPVAHCRHAWRGYLDSGGQEHGVGLLRKAAVMGVCGIGNPEGFRHPLNRHVTVVVGFAAFADHHAYGEEEVRGLLSGAVTLGAQAVVVTEKDWVKWRGLGSVGESKIPIYRPVLRMEFEDGEAQLRELLRGRVLGSRH